MKKKIRVLHCPHIIAGNAQNLARFERKLGLNSWSIALQANPYDYQCDEILSKDKEIRLIRVLKRWVLLFKALAGYDLIHLNFGSTILPLNSIEQSVFTFSIRAFYFRVFEYLDLRLLNIFKKGIRVTFQGDDARQSDFCKDNFTITPANEVGPEYYPPGTDEKKRKNIIKYSNYTDKIYALNPDLLHVLPRNAEFLPYAHIDINEWKYIGLNPGVLQKPVVMHAPSHRGAKGTKYILDAVDRLKSENIQFKFILVEGLPNAEARKQYEKADLLIDQLLAGWYGGLAVELMALGKPVICYIREEDLIFIPDEMRDDLPLINATPDTIYSVLKEWLTVKKGSLNDAGIRSRNFVERWHDPLKIAQKLKNDYEVILDSKKK